MRGERKSKTLRSKLFLYYGVLICSILAVFLIYYFSYNTKLIRNKQLTSMQNISDRILAQYDKELESLDAISINIVSSKLFKNYFFYPAEETLKRPQNIDKMNELVFSITGPMASFYRINVIDGNRYQYSFCTQVRPEAKQLSEENVASWLERTIEKDGERYIVPSEKDDGPQTISICKVFPEIYGMKMNNVIEVQQTYQEFAEYVEAAIAKSEMKNPQIYIYNEDGILLYPLAGEEETDGSEIRWEHLNGQNEQAGVIEEMWETTHFNKNYVAYSKSPASKLTVAVVESEQNILSPLYTFLRTAIMGALLILMVTLAVSYYVARHVTSPLDELYHSVTQFTLADADALKKRRKDSSIFEIDALERAFVTWGNVCRNHLIRWYRCEPMRCSRVCWHFRLR